MLQYSEVAWTGWWVDPCPLTTAPHTWSPPITISVPGIVSTAVAIASPGQEDYRRCVHWKTYSTDPDSYG